MTEYLRVHASPIRTRRMLQGGATRSPRSPLRFHMPISLIRSDKQRRRPTPAPRSFLPTDRLPTRKNPRFIPQRRLLAIRWRKQRSRITPANHTRSSSQVTPLAQRLSVITPHDGRDGTSTHAYKKEVKLLVSAFAS